eukprot:scaffold912_cov187-Ochromonas_danica.AAC.8
MHDWLDGLNRKRRRAGQKKIPSIKVTAIGRDEAERKKLRDGAEVDTTRVYYIKISSANAVLLKDLEDMLKEGSSRDVVLQILQQHRIGRRDLDIDSGSVDFGSISQLFPLSLISTYGSHLDRGRVAQETLMVVGLPL